MVELPDPLIDDFENKLPAIRILSDSGIKQAIREKVLIVDPLISPDNCGNRIQPVTIDIGFENVMSHYSPGGGVADGQFFHEHDTLNAGRNSWIEFEEAISFRQKGCFFSCFLDGRSSLLRLGAAISGRGEINSYHGIEATVFNSSPNDIILSKGEKIAQTFIRVEPYADTFYVPYDRGSKPPLTLEGDMIRSFDMGVQANTNEQLEALVGKGFMKIERKNGSAYEPWNGLILLHASNAFRMRKLDGGILFSQRDKYAKEDLLEEVDIRKRYYIREGEHLVVEAEEIFELSPHVGISMLNNFFGKNFPGAADLSGFVPKRGMRKRDARENLRLGSLNFTLHSIRNSWADPGYKGILAGYPKLLGKSIGKGDVVGYAQVFFFPKGVERPYGSKGLGSKYQGQDSFRL